jgi:hypothetical protein
MPGKPTRQQKQKQNARYREKNRERLRLAAITYRASQPKSGRKRGGQVKHADQSDEGRAVRRRLAVRKYKQSLLRVIERWRWEKFHTPRLRLEYQLGLEAHEAWLDSLDEDAHDWLPPFPKGAAEKRTSNAARAAQTSVASCATVPAPGRAMTLDMSRTLALGPGASAPSRRRLTLGRGAGLERVALREVRLIG